MKNIACFGIACFYFALLGVTACSSEQNNPPRQIQTEGVNNGSSNGSSDPFYQLQEAEAKKHQDSTAPRN